MGEIMHLVSSIDGFQFDALHAQPRSAPLGGVIVLQEIFGIDEFIRLDVQRWADAGYEVLAPSLFDRAERGFSAEHNPDGIDRGMSLLQATGWETPLSDIAACVERLGAAGPVFVVGYCYGGSLAWLAAAKIKGLSAASCYYGGSIMESADLDLLCPVICHFGRQDAFIPVDDVESALRKAHPDLPIYVYENSGHGFNNEGMPGSDANDAVTARKRTMDFFAGAHSSTDQTANLSGD